MPLDGVTLGVLAGRLPRLHGVLSPVRPLLWVRAHVPMLLALCLTLGRNLGALREDEDRELAAIEKRLDRRSLADVMRADWTSRQEP